jgi:hypothetical protein
MTRPRLISADDLRGEAFSVRIDLLEHEAVLDRKALTCLVVPDEVDARDLRTDRTLQENGLVLAEAAGHHGRQ